MSGNGEADLAIYFKSAGGCEKAEGGWFEGIRWGQDYSAVVYSACEGGGLGWTAEGEVPFVEVGF